MKKEQKDRRKEQQRLEKRIAKDILELSNILSFDYDKSGPDILSAIMLLSLESVKKFLVNSIDSKVIGVFSRYLNNKKYLSDASKIVSDEEE